MTRLPELTIIIAIGIGATAFMDVWLMFLKRIGVPTLNFAFIGRWVGHLFRGTFAHASIGQAQPIHGERALGWLTHYAIGIAFAALLVAIQGIGWASNPTVLPAVLVGMATVAAPLFVMQPAMGSGFAASRTPTPLRNCARSIANHTVFGFGLYLTAVLMACVAR
ncbi:hypothetical protein AWV79_18295 [Cupriavidus sp. UYMMa02A]|nr:hypothetical protein AWV79_18295 [Cupriavidus sp. UYMMa02A]